MDQLFSDALRQLLQDHCTPQAVRAIEAGQPAQPLWSQIEESGFANALLSEESAGAGLGLSEAFTLMELCGSFALPVPLAETMLARALLTHAGIAPPPGSISFGEAILRADGGMGGGAVACGRVADWVLLQHQAEGVLLPGALAERSAAIFPLDATMEWTAEAVASAQRVCGMPDVRTLQGYIYATLLSGALMEVFSRTLQYANERHQFGKPIGKFQAIQHQLSVISEHTFAARMSAQIACRGNAYKLDRLCVAVAKARSSEAAVEVAALAHSIHGAIGFTEEFDLQLLTRRLHAWRQAGGSESYWRGVLGAALVDHHTGLTLDLIRTIVDVN